MKLLQGLFLVTVLSLQAEARDVDQWIAPIGIPVPTFGINETHTMYAGDSAYKDAGNGPYTVYVDNTASNCSDSGPATSDKPRCSLPAELPIPGTVVEIHGGPYIFGQVKQTIEINGSAEKPVFVRGIDDGNGLPVFQDASTFTAQGRYFIVENLVFKNTSVRTGGAESPRYGRDHISLRNLEISEHSRKNGSALGGSDIVFYNNHVHHNYGDDRHGTTVARGSNRVWIVDNYFHHNGGDAVQFCHRCKKDAPQNVFVGRNLMHSDRENAVDLKFGKGIVISENTMYGYRVARPDTNWCFDDNSHCGTFSSGSDGAAIVIGSDGAPKNPWILYNNIYDSTQGIRVEEVRDAWIIGNNIHNIENRAIALQKDGDPLYIVANTIFNTTKGIDQYWRHNFKLIVLGNRFVNVKDRSLEVGSRVSTQSSIENNLFWNDDGKVRFYWGRGVNEKSSAGALEFNGGKGNFIKNPKIVASENTISAENPAYGEATVQAFLIEQDEIFRSLFGDSVSIIRKD